MGSMRYETTTDELAAIERGRRFEPAALNVRAARGFVADALADEGFHGDADAVLLLASELCTNAVRHAATPFEIRVDVQSDVVRVAVLDDDAAHPPLLRHPTPDDTNGRGLLIVDELSDAWGSVDVGPRRKAVWFTKQ